MNRFCSSVLVLLVSYVQGGVVVAEEFPLTGENTTIKFTGAKADGKHDGGFKTLAGAAKVEGGEIALSVTIDTTSLFSDDAKLTGHLKSPDFFDVKTNPTAKFVSTKVEKGEKAYTVTGDLTLNGKTKSISFLANVRTGANSFQLTSETFKIDRTEFGMAYGKGKIDDAVSIQVTVSAKK